MPAKKNKNLTPGSFPNDLNWSKEEAVKSLESLYSFVNEECERAITWYFSKKKSKMRFGYFFRIGAILSLTASGIIPILSEIIKPESEYILSPAWATVALVFAGLFISLDKFGGYTTGWIRYIRTGQKLSNLQSFFRIEWEKDRMLLSDTDPTSEQFGISIQKCRDFLQDVNEIVQAETDVWAEEFQKVLIGLEKAVNGKTEKPPK